jgi:hypothetical protein
MGLEKVMGPDYIISKSGLQQIEQKPSRPLLWLLLCSRVPNGENQRASLGRGFEIPESEHFIDEQADYLMRGRNTAMRNQKNDIEELRSV